MWRTGLAGRLALISHPSLTAVGQDTTWFSDIARPEPPVSTHTQRERHQATAAALAPGKGARPRSEPRFPAILPVRASPSQEGHALPTPRCRPCKPSDKIDPLQERDDARRRQAKLRPPVHQPPTLELGRTLLLPSPEHSTAQRDPSASFFSTSRSVGSWPNRPSADIVSSHPAAGFGRRQSARATAGVLGNTMMPSPGPPK